MNWTLVKIASAVSAALLLAACVTTPAPSQSRPSARATSASPTPGGGTYKVGNPYQVAGVWYYPKEQPTYDETGIASWYGADFHGHLTADGEVFDRNGISAAHPTLPMPVP